MSKMADLGLNIFQVIQNELITREASRSTLGLGFRLAIIEERVSNSEAISRNGRVWKLNHAISPLKAITPEARAKSEHLRRKLLGRKEANKQIDDKDPTKFIRDTEVWDVHEHFPRTVLEFKQLQFHPERVRSLLHFYDVKAYRPDQRIVDTHADEDGVRDVHMNIETCLEELSIAWGLNWFRIEGMALPRQQ